MVPALVAIGWVSWWAWRRWSPLVGLTLLVLLVVNPMAVERASQARGYGLALLGSVGMLVWALMIEERGSGWIAFAVAAFVAIATFPLAVVGFLGHVLALLLAGGVDRKKTLATLAAVGVSTALFFSPMLPDMMGQPAELSSSKGLSPAMALAAQAQAAAQAPEPSLVTEAVGQFFPVPLSTPSAAALAIILIMALPSLGLPSAYRRHRAAVRHAALPVALTVLAGAVLLGAGLVPRPRFVIFLLAHGFLLWGLGLAELARRWLATPAARTVGALLASGLAVLLLASAFLAAVEYRRVPYEDYRTIAQIVESSPAERSTPTGAGVSLVWSTISGPTRSR